MLELGICANFILHLDMALFVFFSIGRRVFVGIARSLGSAECLGPCPTQTNTFFISVEVNRIFVNFNSFSEEAGMIVACSVQKCFLESNSVITIGWRGTFYLCQRMFLNAIQSHPGLGLPHSICEQ